MSWMMATSFTAVFDLRSDGARESKRLESILKLLQVDHEALED